MDEREQQEFISWLGEYLQAKDQSDFEQKVQQLGEEGIKEAHLNFKKSKIKQYMTGGKLERIKELQKIIGKQTK